MQQHHSKLNVVYVFDNTAYCVMSVSFVNQVWVSEKTPHALAADICFLFVLGIVDAVLLMSTCFHT